MPPRSAGPRRHHGYAEPIGPPLPPILTMTATPEPIARWRWAVVWLLFLATVINYMDRQALANTQAAVLAEFVPLQPGDDPQQIEKARNALYAEINFAFGMSFAIFQIVAGFLIDRGSLRWLYVGAILLWSAAGVLTGFVPSGAVAFLMACRMALGIGEAFNWPCAVACVRRVVPRESRGLANGIFHSGASIGAFATPLVVLLLVANDGTGWRNVFVVVGTLGAAWVVLWVWVTRGERGTVIDGREARQDDARPPVWPAFLTLLFWVGLVSLVCVNVCWHFYNQWLPRYMSQELHYDLRTQQWILAGFYIAADLGAMLSGWTIRKLTRSGRSVERSRKLVMTGLALIAASATVPAAFSPADMPEVKFAFFYLVAAAVMGGFAVAFALVQDVCPPNTALVLGVCGCVSWVTISVVGLGVGQVAAPGNYAWLFVGVGSVYAVAALAGWLWPEADGHGNSSAPST